jgi:ATP-dependent protease HslVU (ClpYQ) ATPase subunit
MDLTPKQVVDRLDRYIVGQVTHRHLCYMQLASPGKCSSRSGSANAHLMQAEAKRAVANALRNRWRRRQIASPMKVLPAQAIFVAHQITCDRMYRSDLMHGVRY